MIVTYPSSVGTTHSGFTLFATNNLPAGTVVEKYDGPIATRETVPDEEMPYVVRLGNGQWLMPKSNARFLNYSCEPNCTVTDTLEVVTNRPVAKGELLTVPHRSINMQEYLDGSAGANTWNARWTMQCQCGSPRCIGRIDGYIVTIPEDPNSLKVRVGTTGNKGRGVFAARPILKGEVVERAPIIIIPESQWDLVETTVLRNYTFSWGPNDEHAALALGYLSLYNHSYTPNAIYIQSPEDAVIEIEALRDIESGEEILVNYNGEPDDPEPLWFPTV